MRRWSALAGALPVLAVALGGDLPRPDAVTSARAFLASLDDSTRVKAVLPLDDDYRTLWRYVPAHRRGVSWKDLRRDQTSMVTALLKASLGDLGFSRVDAVRKLESVLAAMERNPTGRDMDEYYFTFFGSPDNTGMWGWRYEGHHVSLNFTYKGSNLVASTPQFFGANPATVQGVPQQDMRMLALEEDMAFAILHSMSSEQRMKAVLSDAAPADIFTSQNRKAARIDERGLSYAEMTVDQQATLIALVKQVAAPMRPEEAARRMAAIEKAGHEKLLFAWMGAEGPGTGHYYRIQGPTFLIEFDNIQNRANHIHLVWRDFKGDFGRDVLAEHHQHGHTH